MKVQIGWVVIDPKSAAAVKTGRTWGSRLAKVYTTVGTARGVATQRGLTYDDIHPCFVEIADDAS